MHHVSKINEAAAKTPPLYIQHSTGFRRATYVDRAMGSVHMGVGICYLDPGGVIHPHLHSFEESFYVLEGNLELQNHSLKPGDFGLIGTGLRHQWRNTSDRPARWLEMQAPQPRVFDHGAEYGKDTFFLNDDGSTQADALLDHFDESQLPKP